MTMRIRSLSLIILVTALVAVSCTQTSGANDEELADRAFQLGHVATALNGLIQYGNPSPDLTGDQLLQEATKDNPDLLKPFADYYLTARREGKFGSVLMCNKLKMKALAEDATCTAILDDRIWSEAPEAPCTFRLNLLDVCGNH